MLPIGNARTKTNKKTLVDTTWLWDILYGLQHYAFMIYYDTCIITDVIISAVECDHEFINSTECPHACYLCKLNFFTPFFIKFE